MYVAWQRRSFTTVEKHFPDIVRDAVVAALRLQCLPYARCAGCQSGITDREVNDCETAEVVRGGKSALVHQSCMMPGEQPA